MGQFDGGTRILRVIHGQDARATFETDPLPPFSVLVQFWNWAGFSLRNFASYFAIFAVLLHVYRKGFAKRREANCTRTPFRIHRLDSAVLAATKEDPLNDTK